jgi:ATP-dependent Clp protease protease subunit
MDTHAIVMKKSDGANVDEIDIFGTIGQDWWGDGVSQAEVINAVRASKAKSIRVNINSGGGSIFEGMAMYDAIKGASAKTTAKVIGFAGSMATIVMLAADTVEIVDGSLLMVHNPSTGVQGEAKDLRKQAEVLDKLRDGMVRIYSGKSGLTTEEVVALLDEETWLDAVEAKSLGLVDSIVGEESEAKAALGHLDLIASAPSAKIPMRFAATLGGVSPEGQPGKNVSTEPGEEAPVATTIEVKEALGLDAEATDEEVLEAVQALTEDDDAEGDDDEGDDEADEEGDEDDADEDAEDEDEDDEEDDAEALSIPDGYALVDLEDLEDLKQRAAKADAGDEGFEARDKAIVAKAISEGRIPAAKEAKYLKALASDFDTFSAMLTKDESEGGLPKGLIPVSEIGTSHDSASDEAGGTPVAYDASLFPQLANKAAGSTNVIETE